MTAAMISARLVEVARVPAHEGPVWFPEEKARYYTSVPGHGPDGVPQVRIDRLPLDQFPLHELTGPVGAGRVHTVASDTNAANGMCADGSGGLLVCEQGGPNAPARVSRLDPLTGVRETVVAALDGRPLNSPNDITRHPDGSIWFTDPSYGWYQGFRPQPAIPDGVHRYDPGTGEHTLVTAAFDKPNGLAFSPDGQTLYVGDSGANHQPGSFDPSRPHAVTALQVHGGHVDAELWSHTVPFGFPDGLKPDGAGRVWFTTDDGLRVLSPDGDHLGDVPLPGAVNFTFVEGDDALLVTADTAVWAVLLDQSR
ncbi:MAG TPA: SMP-30/gluconolactonase/LRE family protein [Jatrophihabitans sp.]|nr:SMP-30/gluconolactonase/LRE family protein [Jatrophihabitans sp.]